MSLLEDLEYNDPEALKTIRTFAWILGLSFMTLVGSCFGAMSYCNKPPPESVQKETLKQKSQSCQACLENISCKENEEISDQIEACDVCDDI